MYLFYVCLLAPLIQNGFSLIGEETDLNSLSSYDAVDDLNENYEIWNTAENDDAGIVIFDSISRQMLENICENSNTLVYITEEDITIDCKTFNKGDQPIDTVQNIVKRSADEEELEGSGDDKPESDENVVKSETNEEIITTTQETNVEPEPNEDQKESEPEPQEESVQVAQEAESETTSVSEENEVTTTEAAHETTTETQATTQISEETVVTTDQPEEIPTIKVEDVQTEPETDVPTTTEQNDKENEPKTNENTEQILNKEGSENTINKEGKEQGTKKGKTLLSANGNEKHDNDDEPAKTDKSTESTKTAGSKDTTILIVLFVAVVVVGALAFAYNFIKKRKRQNADLERVERAPSIKRSLQNLTQGGGEPEKKPLIGDNKEVEMVDMKKETSTLKENGESLPNETTVKT